MSNPRLGRETDPETGGALVCNAVADGDPETGPICGKPASHHLRWDTEPYENSFTCLEHFRFALDFGPRDQHSVTGSPCGLPGTAWVPCEPSYCELDTELRCTNGLRALENA
jgi:hypothetical protein